jgi:hypothetical protein
VGSDVVREARSKADRLVVPLDSVLDEQEVDVGRLAGTGLGKAAEEVEVLVALRVDGALDGHASRSAGSVAAAAEQGALEVVVVHATTLLRGGS